MSGRGNVVNALNRGRLVRVELDPAVAQLDDLPRGLTSLSGGELVHVDVAQAQINPDDYIGDAVRPHRVRRPGDDPGGHDGGRPRRHGRLPEGRHRPRGAQGDPARDDRPLRADGQPDRRARCPAEPELAADQGLAGRPGRLRLEVRRALLPVDQGLRPGVGRERLRPAERPRRRHLRPQRRHPRRPQGAGQRGHPRRHRPRDQHHQGRARRAQPGRRQLHPCVPRSRHPDLGRPHPVERAGVALPQRAPAVQLPRGLDPQRHPVGRVRAQRPGAVGEGAPQHRRLP